MQSKKPVDAVDIKIMVKYTCPILQHVFTTTFYNVDKIYTSSYDCRGCNETHGETCIDVMDCACGKFHFLVVQSW